MVDYSTTGQFEVKVCNYAIITTNLTLHYVLASLLSLN